MIKNWEIFLIIVLAAIIAILAMKLYGSRLPEIAKEAEDERAKAILNFAKSKRGDSDKIKLSSKLASIDENMIKKL